MNNNKSAKLIVSIIIVFVLSLLFIVVNSYGDDIELFSVKVKPNILFLLDNSGSMNTKDVILNSANSFKTYTTSAGDTYSFDVDEECIRWHFDFNSGTLICDEYERKTRRYIALQRITIELLDKFRNDAYMGVESFFYKKNKLGEIGLYKGYGKGGEVLLELKDLSEDNNLKKMTDVVYNVITPIGGTPLAESLDTAYGYFTEKIKDGDGNYFYDGFDRPRVCKDVNSNFECSDTNVKSPLKWWCQKNFIILVTDGTPTDDTFDNGNSDYPYKYYPYLDKLKNKTQWDYDKDRDSNDKKQREYSINNGSHLLDDIAKYIYDKDMIPDDKSYFNLDSSYDSNFNEKQNIITYTVGFKTNQELLKKTASNSSGKYFTVDNFSQLRENLMRAIFDIIQRNYAFTSFTAPKKIASGENVTFVGFFIPKYDSIWEGHLKAYEIKNDGSLGNFLWDVAEEIPDLTSRKLYTLKKDLSLVEFTTNSLSDIKPLLQENDDTKAERIINFIRGKRETNDPPYLLADIFHSDIQFVGAPLAWKKNIEKDYDTFYTKYENRKKMIYFGTNDGIFHAVNTQNGEEIRGFIPDEVLPSLKKIVLDNRHVENTDGRISVEDIFKYDPSTKKNEWKTLLVFGLRNGGEAYYGLDISDPDNMKFMWKIGKRYNSPQPSYVNYLGDSWAKPVIGKIKIKQGTITKAEDKSVVIIPGGYADNAGDSTKKEGKSIMIFDAWTGQLLWMLAYDPSVDEQTEDHMYTSNSHFNYPIASSFTAIDKNNDRFIDTLYFGNTGGNLFKLDISNPDPSMWKLTTLFYQDNVKQPVYLSPGVVYDNCFKLWVIFGTGDRENPKANEKGYFVAIKDTGEEELQLSDLKQISWGGDTLPDTTISSSDKGWYFEFEGKGEKLFDPDMVIVPDNNSVPHVLFNTFKLPSGVAEDPCKYGGNMTFYEIILSTCPVGKISGQKEEGRVAGGGFGANKEYVLYEGKGNIGSTEVKNIKKFKLPYLKGLVFWQERRR